MVKAAVLRAVNEPLTLEEIEVAEPKAGELRIRFAASGVCHSDLSIVNGTLFGTVPVVLGHEGAGVVDAVGDDVNGFEVGDHVVVSWVPQCGNCDFCVRGQGYLCTSASAAMGSGGLLDGTTRFTLDGEPLRQMLCCGTFSEVAVVPAIGAVKIPRDVPLDVAALIGCGVLTGVGAAVNTANIQPGDKVVVVGCGGVGLNVIQGARIAGASQIVAVDMVPSKLELAKSFGATDVVDASDGDPVKAVTKLTGGGAHVGFEVIGLKATIDQTISMVRRGGEAVLVGVPRSDVMIELPAFFSLVLMSKTIKGCWYGSSNVHADIPKLVGWYQDGSLKLDELISRRIDLADVNDAFRAMESGEVARTVITYPGA